MQSYGAVIGHERELQILICSANLGNAQPDDISWNLWVPENGYSRYVIKNQKYPIKKHAEDDDNNENSNSHNDNEMIDLYNDEQNGLYPEEYAFEDLTQFDIIVFGLQESTFDPPKDTTAANSVDNDTASVVSSTLGPESNHNHNNNKKAHTPKSTGTVGKIISNFSNLTASRDHNKGINNNNNNNTDVYNNPGISSHSGDFSIAGNEHQQKNWLGGTHVLHAMMGRRLPSYDRVVSFQRGEMRLAIFVHKTQISTEVIHVSAQNTGRAGLANKGGIVAELLINRNTRLSFLTAHLEAHEGATKYQTRISTIADILSGTKEKTHDISLTSHYSFVMGDLNFRTEMPNHDALGEEQHKHLVRNMALKNDFKNLNSIDELHRALHNKECLVGYKTLYCNFPPTFKVERQPGYTYIDKRRPSYTDRVLWKAGHQLHERIRPLSYEPIDNFSTSDHKPIRAAFGFKLNEPFISHAKMVRRRSLIQTMTKRSKGGTSLTQTERFHLFVSDIACSVYTKEKSTWTPNPYVAFISDPVEMLQHDVKKGWKKFMMKRFSINKKSTTHYTKKGFPRTHIQKNTFNVTWGDDEIHSEIRTITPDGAPIDLTGSTLRITVMDYHQSSDDSIIGTFVLNLVNLIKECRPSTDETSHNNKRQRQSSGRPGRRMSLINMFRGSKQDDSSRGGGDRSDHQSHSEPAIAHITENGTGGGSSHNNNNNNVEQQQPRPTTRRMSLLNVFRRSGKNLMAAADSNSKDQDNDPISSINIDEAIVKNGVETGRIRCKVETWYMDDTMVNAFGGFMSRRNSNLASSAGSGIVVGGGGGGGGSDHHHNLLTERRETKRQQMQSHNSARHLIPGKRSSDGGNHHHLFPRRHNKRGTL